jgi:hypothetical protein
MYLRHRSRPPTPARTHPIDGVWPLRPSSAAILYARMRGCQLGSTAPSPTAGRSRRTTWRRPRRRVGTCRTTVLGVAAAGSQRRRRRTAGLPEPPRIVAILRSEAAFSLEAAPRTDAFGEQVQPVCPGHGSPQGRRPGHRAAPAIRATDRGRQAAAGTAGHRPQRTILYARSAMHRYPVTPPPGQSLESGKEGKVTGVSVIRRLDMQPPRCQPEATQHTMQLRSLVSSTWKRNIARATRQRIAILHIASGHRETAHGSSGEGLPPQPSSSGTLRSMTAGRQIAGLDDLPEIHIV